MWRTEPVHWAETSLTKALEVVVIADLGLGGGYHDGGRAGTDGRDAPDRRELLETRGSEGQFEEPGVEEIVADEREESPGRARNWCSCRGSRGGGCRGLLRRTVVGTSGQRQSRDRRDGDGEAELHRQIPLAVAQWCVQYTFIRKSSGRTDFEEGNSQSPSATEPW